MQSLTAQKHSTACRQAAEYITTIHYVNNPFKLQIYLAIAIHYYTISNVI